MPESLAAMAEIAERWATRTEDPPVRSASIFAAVSDTAMLSGGTPKASMVPMSAMGTPVTARVSPVILANADPAPSSTPAACNCASVSTIVPAGLTAMPAMSARLARMAEDPPARSAWMCAAVSDTAMVVGAKGSARMVPISAVVTCVTTRSPPDNSANTDPAPSSTCAARAWVCVRVTVPESLTAMPEIVPTLATSFDAPDARSAWIWAAVSEIARRDGGTERASKVAMSDTAMPVTARVSPVILERMEPAPLSTCAASACATVRVIVPLSLTTMPAMTDRWASSSELPPVRSAWRSAAVSLTWIVSGGTPSARTVAMSATGTPVTSMVPPVSSDSADPAPSSTPAASICASVRWIVPASLTAMPAMVARLVRMADVPAIRSAWIWAAVSLSAMWVGAKGSPTTVPVSATVTPVTIRPPPLRTENTDPAPSSICAARTCVWVSAMLPASLTAMDEIPVRCASSADEPEVRSA